MYNLYNKKPNIKSFFKKVTEYSLLKDFFEMNDVQGFPLISQMEDTQAVDIIYNFYTSLEDDIRKKIKTELDKLIFISNYQAIKIAETFINKNTQNNIIADSYQEKALSFYLDNNQNILKVINIYSFYKVSGWRRFESVSSNNLSNNLSNLNLENVIDSWKEKYIQKYFEDNKVYPNIIDSDIYFYDKKYFAFMDINTEGVTSSNVKRVFIVILPEIGESMIKMSGSFVEVFFMLDLFLKKLANITIDIKEEKYNFDRLFDNIEDETNNIFNSPSINNWRIKSLNIKNNQNILNLKFNKTSNSKNFYDMSNFSKNYNIDFKQFEIDNVSFDFDIILNSIDVIKKKVSLNLKKNKSNLNLLKDEHLLLYKILKEKSVFEGFVNINF